MFIKYINERHLDSILGDGRVRLSTFWHFMADEQPEIGDANEGQSGYMFLNNTAEPWEITPELLDAAAMSDEGHFRFSQPKFLPPGDESWVEAAGGFNTFMYSLTQADAPSTSLMERLGYDAAVEICDIAEFAKHTSQALLQLVNREYGFDRQGITRVRSVLGSVTYVKSKRQTVTPSTVDLLKDSAAVDARELFTKLDRFNYQSEYRIAYLFMNPDNEKAVSLGARFPNLLPVIVGDAGTPRIAKTIRLIGPSEFAD